MSKGCSHGTIHICVYICIIIIIIQTDRQTYLEETKNATVSQSLLKHLSSLDHNNKISNSPCSTSECGAILSIIET